MKVKSKLYFGAGLTALFTGVFVALVFLFSTSTQQKLADANYVDQLVKGTTEFSFLSEQYISYGLNRIEQQWDVKLSDVDALLSKIGHSPAIEQVRTEIASIDGSFQKLKSLRHKEESLIVSGVNGGTLERLKIEKGRAVTRLRLNYTRISSLAFQLSRQINHEIEVIQEQKNVLVTVFAAGLFLVLAYVAFFITGQITKKISQLGKSVAAISHGDLGVSVPYLGRDELGEFAEAFDDMRIKRRKAEERLRENEENLKRAQAVAHIGSWYHDLKKNTLTWSDEAYRIFDIPKGRPLSYQDFLATVYKEDREFVDRNWDKTRQHNSYNIEHRILVNGRIKWVNEKANIEFSEDGEALRAVGTVQDITERKSLEEQISRTQKLDAVGHLSGGICHDFNNILGIVLGNLELLQDGLMDETEKLQYVNSAIKASNRGADLTKKLLSFSRKTSSITNLINANEHIANLQDFIARSLTVEISVETMFAHDLWPTEVDPGELEDAILNLALNARDAMPSGGTLIIETANKVLDERYTKRRTDTGLSEYVMISISDTGTGMTDEVKGKAFDPFFTTKDSNKGTGLGLSMIYGFVRRSGGQVRIYSELGIGTTIRIFLPRANNLDKRLAPPKEITRELPRGQESILLVDDEEALANVAASNLEKLGYNIFTANSGSQAVKILKENNNIRLLFTDLIMPGDMDGLELASVAHSKNPKLKILLTSGFHRKLRNEEGEYASELLSHVLIKPYNKSDLATAIRDTLDQTSFP